MFQVFDINIFAPQISVDLKICLVCLSIQAIQQFNDSTIQQKEMAQAETFKKLVSHCKEYGFIYQSSDIYDGLAAVYELWSIWFFA